MSAESKSARAASALETIASEAFSKSVLRRGEWWLKAPAEFCAQMQEANARWLAHRQRDLDNGFAALRQLAASRDFGEAAAIQQKWFAGYMQSIVADWTDLMRPFAERPDAEPPRAKETAVSARAIPKQAAA